MASSRMCLLESVIQKRFGKARLWYVCEGTDITSRPHQMAFRPPDSCPTLSVALQSGANSNRESEEI
jgi:hypothetical protein